MPNQASTSLPVVAVRVLPRIMPFLVRTTSGSLPVKADARGSSSAILELLTSNSSRDDDDDDASCATCSSCSWCLLRWDGEPRQGSGCRTRSRIRLSAKRASSLPGPVRQELLGFLDILPARLQEREREKQIINIDHLFNYKFVVQNYNRIYTSYKTHVFYFCKTINYADVINLFFTESLVQDIFRYMCLLRLQTGKLLGTQMFEGTILRVTLLPLCDRKCYDERVRD